MAMGEFLAGGPTQRKVESDWAARHLSEKQMLWLGYQLRAFFEIIFVVIVSLI